MLCKIVKALKTKKFPIFYRDDFIALGALLKGTVSSDKALFRSILNEWGIYDSGRFDRRVPFDTKNYQKMLEDLEK